MGTRVLPRLLVVYCVFGLVACSRLLVGNYSTQLKAIEPGTYMLDPAHASVIFRVDHLGLSQYVGRFNKFEASLDYDVEGGQSARLQAVVDTGSIDVNNAGFEKTLAGGGWLDSGEYPQAILLVDAAPQISSEGLVYNASFTLRGVTRDVPLLVQFNGGAQNRLTGRYTLGFAAKAAITRADFGITRFAGLVGNEVEIEIHAEFQRVASTAAAP
ncbi:MAG: YceI family protein [Pseudomonadales bacterium]